MVVVYILAAIGLIFLLGVIGLMIMLSLAEDYPEDNRTETKRIICALTDENCIFTTERLSCNGCPVAEEAEKIGDR